MKHIFITLVICATVIWVVNRLTDTELVVRFIPDLSALIRKADTQ